MSRGSIVRLKIRGRQPSSGRIQSLKIALDVDGVLADVIVCWIDLFKQLYGRSISKSDIVTWDFWRDIGMSRSEFHRTLSQVWEEWWNIPPTEDDLSDKVDTLRELGKVDIVTGRERNTHQSVRRWLEDKNIVYNSFIAVSPNTSKAHLKYDIFIDDAPKNVEKAALNRKYAILYDQPWNRNVKESDRIIRVKSLEEAVGAIKRFV